MKNGFIELMDQDGVKVYVNISNILWIEKYEDNLTMIYVAASAHESNRPSAIYVKDEYEDIKALLID